jgi:hypothetical protein
LMSIAIPSASPLRRSRKTANSSPRVAPFPARDDRHQAGSGIRSDLSRAPLIVWPP